MICLRDEDIGCNLSYNEYYLIANKILRKFDQLNLAYIRNEIDGFVEFLDQTFGEGVMVECKAFLERLKKTI